MKQASLTHTHTHNRKQMVKKRYQNSVCCEGEQAQIIGRMGENNDRSVHEKMKEILTMYGLYVLSFFVLCLLISQNSNAQMPDTHTGMVRDVSVLQCTWIEQVSYISNTHTHTRQTQSSWSKPDRFDMLSLPIPTGVCLCVCYTCIWYHGLQLPRRKF